MILHNRPSRFALVAKDNSVNAVNAATSAANAANKAVLSFNNRNVGKDGSFASGLAYVPRDGFIGELHRAEMIIPSNVANWMRGAGIGGMIEPKTDNSKTINNAVISELKSLRKEVEHMRKSEASHSKTGNALLANVSKGINNNNEIISDGNKAYDRLNRKLLGAV